MSVFADGQSESAFTISKLFWAVVLLLHLASCHVVASFELILEVSKEEYSFEHV